MICALAVLILAAGSAQADLSNPSFETGTLMGWSTTIPSLASVSVVTGHTDSVPGAGGETSWAPTDGSNFALLETGGADNFTQLYQSFTAPAGYELTFDYFWDSGESGGAGLFPVPWDDTGKGRLLSGVGPGGATETTFFTHTVNTDPGEIWGTPWTSVSYTIPSAGTYTLLFEVANFYDDARDSYLGVDNAHVVPVQAAVLLGILGLGVAGWKLRRFA